MLDIESIWWWNRYYEDLCWSALFLSLKMSSGCLGCSCFGVFVQQWVQLCSVAVQRLHKCPPLSLYESVTVTIVHECLCFSVCARAYVPTFIFLLLIHSRPIPCYKSNLYYNTLTYGHCGYRARGIHPWLWLLRLLYSTLEICMYIIGAFSIVILLLMDIVARA